MTADPSQRRTILMADDDAEDCLLVRDALREAGRDCDLRFVRDGEELFDYLHGRGEFAGSQKAPRPDLILLDLKMPCKDGRETLRELKADPRFRQIPVIAFTTSTASDDVEYSYGAGVNAYITKPASFRELVEVFDLLGKYWLDVVELPTKTRD
jgi:CheY-like chemotaxis protein